MAAPKNIRQNTNTGKLTFPSAPEPATPAPSNGKRPVTIESGPVFNRDKGIAVSTIDFLTGQYTVSGKRVSDVSSYTFSRATQALYSSGAIAATNVMRRETDGVLYELAGAQILENPSFTGGTVGIIGSGGVLPTKWEFSNNSVVRELLDQGVLSDGRHYVTLRVSRTGGTPSTTTVTFRGALNNAFPVVTGPVTASGSIRIDAASGAFSYIAFGAQEYSSSNVFIGSTSPVAAQASTVGVTLSPAVWRSIPSGNKATLIAAINLSNATADFSVTYTLIGPQLELRADATATTLMTDTVLVRAVDDLKLIVPNDSAKDVVQLYQRGGFWTNQTPVNNKIALTPNGDRTSKLTNVAAFEQGLSFTQKVAKVDIIKPLLYTPVLAPVTIDGTSYGYDSAEMPHSIQQSTNRVSRFRTEVRPGEYWTGSALRDRNRAELSGTTYYPMETDLWFSVSIFAEYFDPKRFSFFLFTQLKCIEEAGEPGSSPPFQFAIGTAGDLQIITRYTSDPIHTVNPSGTTLHSFPNFPFNTWFNIVLRIRLSYSGTGELQCWYNGIQPFPQFTGINVGYNNATNSHYWKIGQYHGIPMPDGSAPVVVSFANLEAGVTSLASRVTAPLDVA
jgi:hypothetical protein